MDLFNDNGAELSKDRKYRYALWRIWQKDKGLLLYICLNPSKANEVKDDNTVIKIKKITAHNGYGGFYIMNLFAYVTAHPEELLQGGNILSNDGWLEKIAPKCEKVVFAWGNFKQSRERSKEVIKMFPDAYCLFQNLNGTPKHPLYCLDETKLIKFDINKLKI